MKPCPFCGKVPQRTPTGTDWNTRPIEDALQAQVDALQKQLANKDQQCFEQDRANVRLASERNRYRAALEEELRVASEGLEHCKDNDLDDDGLQECVDRLTKALGETK